MNPSLVREIFEKEFKRLGFKKQGSKFIKVCGKVSVHVWLQRSSYAQRFYFNIGAVYEGGPPVTCRESDWHLNTRGESVSPNPETARSVLNEDIPMSPTEREAELVDLIWYVNEYYLNPWSDVSYIFDLARRESQTAGVAKITTFPFRNFVAALDKIH